MSETIRFEIPFYRYLDASGNAVAELPELARDRDGLLALYRNMQLTRIYDQQAITLQRTGQMGTYASTLGMEAIGAAIGHAMQESDIFVPAYREAGAQLARGMRIRDLLLYWGGDERGMDFPGCRQDLPIAVPIASQTLHAAGAAYALKIRKTPQAVLCALGDGATSKGDFYEAINFAGVLQLPLVFVINNNQWAISVSRNAQSASETLAQKAIAAGVEGLQVDGNDVIALTHHLSLALEKARSGGGCTLVEALCYRLCDHTTADDASRYRPKDEVEDHWKEEPITRLHSFLEQQHDWSSEDELALLAQCRELVEAEVQHYLETPPQPPQSMFDSLYAELPSALQWQREELLQQAEEQ